MRFCGGNFEQQRFTHLLFGHLASELLHVHVVFALKVPFPPQLLKLLLWWTSGT